MFTDILRLIAELRPPPITFARCDGFWQVMPFYALILDELGHHLAGPQRKHELQL